jgi:T-complex protein 1 subunit gamma
MLKMLMDPMGGIVMTNDGNAILREITVQHPAGKSMIEIARTQDEEVNIKKKLGVCQKNLIMRDHTPSAHTHFTPLLLAASMNLEAKLNTLVWSC